jgi:hypothetical protein
MPGYAHLKKYIRKLHLGDLTSFVNQISLTTDTRFWLE